MNLRRPLWLSLLVIAGMFGASLWAWSQLPADLRIAIHFDLDGTPNGYAGKTQGLLILPAIALVLTAVMAFLPRLEPRREHLAGSAGLLVTAWIGALLLVAFAHGAILARALGHPLPLDRLLPGLLGLFWIVLGRQLGRCQSTFFLGIRTPWTLSSEYAWQRTHRLAGHLFVAAGGVTLLGALLPHFRAAMTVFLVTTLGSAVVSVAASWFYWRADPALQRR